MSGSYIFRFEGHYRMTEKETKGFVFHLANDQNFSRIQLASSFNMRPKQLLSFPLISKLLTPSLNISEKMAIQLIGRW